MEVLVCIIKGYFRYIICITMTLHFLDIMVAALILIVLGSAPFQFKLLLCTTSLVNQTASSSPFIYILMPCAMQSIKWPVDGWSLVYETSVPLLSEMIRAALAAEYTLELGRQGQVIMVHQVFACILYAYKGNVHGMSVCMHLLSNVVLV